MKPAVDAARFADVASFLTIQEKEARWWRDAALTYFQTLLAQPIPARYEQPAHPLAFYQRITLSGQSRQAALRRDSLINSCIIAR